jgi:hypothetical protein
MPARLRILFAATGVIILGTPDAFGQPFSAGIIGGASLTQDFQNREVGIPTPVLAYSTPKRWMVGGIVELALPLRFSIEADGIYRELEFTRAGVEPNGTFNSVSPAPVVTWEFPVLAKYRFSLPIAKPFLGAGPVFRTAGNLNGANPSHYGIAAGIGLEFSKWRLRIAPELRYQRWGRDRGVTYFAPSTVQNEADFLLSVSF